MSGTLAFLLGTGCLLLVTCRAFPGLFITPQLQTIFANHWFPIGLFIAMPLAFSLALLNFVLRPNKTLGFVAVGVTLLASLIGGLVSVPTSEQGVFGLDFFVLNVVFTGLLFIPMERMFGTHYLPKGKWPDGYGVGGHPVPSGYWQQFLYPFKR